VRQETAFDPPPGVRALRGSALEASDVANAIDGQDAVVSYIGPQRVNPRNPWSRLRPPLHVAELSARTVVAALKKLGRRRFGAISAAGVGDSLATANPVIKYLVRHTTIGEMYADLEAMENVLSSSGLDWFAVRPVTLIDANPSRRTKTLQRFRTMSVVPRADVAAWLLRTIADPTPINQRTPIIGWW
jgi:uncharacterized protein YbjT (DUF2867 family)